MKKILLVTALLLGVTFAASAQPRAVGVRLGWGFDASYQHTVHNADFVEVDLGLNMFDDLGFKATGMYNFMIAQPKWTNKGEWGFYAGPGFSIGNVGHAFMFSVNAQVGLDYTFWFPLQLAIDLRPQFGFLAGGHEASFFESGLFGFVPTLSVRYSF